MGADIFLENSVQLASGGSRLTSESDIVPAGLPSVQACGKTASPAPTGCAVMLQNAKTLADIFEVVKNCVWKSIGRTRGGLMLGLADLGNSPGGFFGAFYPVGTNIIVMNRVPLMRIKETQPGLFNSYAFHVLCHEYLHTLGFLEERVVRRYVYIISLDVFGKDHPTTQIAMDTPKFFPNLVYPEIAWQPEDLDIEFVNGFDRSSASYIA